MEVAILSFCFVVMTMIAINLAVRLKYAKCYIPGDQWNHKGVLHITHDEDGTYMSLELDSATSLFEIAKNTQVIFDVKVHDARSR